MSNTKIISKDGKTYEYTPGKHGSTVVRVSKQREAFVPTGQIEKRAKTVPTFKTATGSTRG